MKPDSRNLESLREFFEIHKGLTNSQLAIVANTASCTIVDWKRKCGIIKSDYKKPPKKAKGPIPENWDNKEWFEKAYQKMGLRAIALLIGKGTNWQFVARRLATHGIPRKTLAERTASLNPCCDEGWLHYYYADRADYLKWCRKTRIKPCKDGGQRLPTAKCAEHAGVSPNTITNWLTTHKMKIRGTSEAQTGPSNAKHRELSIAERRKDRDRFFEMYRAGTINMIIGRQHFSNGTRVDKTETVNKRFNTSVRGTPACSSSSQ
jgi:hypothetical protein